MERTRHPALPLHSVIWSLRTSLSLLIAIPEETLPPAMAETERHPFLQGLSKHRGAPPTVVVIFGASGDLTARKLIPAVYNLSYDNLLPADFFLVGFGRKPIPDDEFRKLAEDAIREFSRRELKEEP